jgi:hypothetical protein
MWESGQEVSALIEQWEGGGGVTSGKATNILHHSGLQRSV